MPKMRMQAIRVHDYGGPEVLVLEETPRPEPNADQVLIRLRAAGVNPADWKYRSGLYKQFMPLQAEYALTKTNEIQPKPASLTFEEAASLPMGALTAWGALINTANVEAGQHVLIHGAAGGVGAYAVQLARWKGAHVTGTASAKNLEFVRSLGAETMIDYQVTPFETVVHDMDVVIDTVGGDLPERSWQVLRPGGIFVTIAARLAEDAGKAQNIRAVSAGRAPVENLKQISELIEAKQLKPVTGAVFPLADARKAHELSQTGHGRGRIILQIGNAESN